MSDILTITRPDWHADYVDLNAKHSSDEERMRFVIALAMENVNRKTGGPFAAAIYDSDSGTLLAAEVNSVERLGCTLFHAETTTIAAAQATVKPLSLRATSQVDDGQQLRTVRNVLRRNPLGRHPRAKLRRPAR